MATSQELSRFDRSPNEDEGRASVWPVVLDRTRALTLVTIIYSVAAFVGIGLLFLIDSGAKPIDQRLEQTLPWFCAFFVVLWAGSAALIVHRTRPSAR